MSDAQALLEAGRMLARKGLNTTSAGNLSVRQQGGMLITASGFDAERDGPESLVLLGADWQPVAGGRPSSEWRFHAAIYEHWPDAGAVIHTHSPFATALACQRQPIPPFHYMIARFGGDDVRCADYATFGTRQLSDNMLAALAGRHACLLANHGMVVYGSDVGHALGLALELETLCEQYWRTLQLGPPALLSAAEMAAVHERLADYGRPH